MSCGSLHDVLREAGRTAHARLDAGLADRLRHPDGYTQLLQMLHAFHSVADPLLQSWVATSMAAPEVVVPSRASAFAGDLAVLDSPITDPVSMDGLQRRGHDDVLADPSGFALLYVVAGSSIGARVLLASLPGGISHHARQGLREGASPPSVELWRRTRTALAHAAPPRVSVPAAAACLQIFALLQPGVG